MSGKAPEPEESLSATAMFLRALQATPPQTPGEPQPPAYSSAPIHPEPIQAPPPAPAEPGEFTRMFRAVPVPDPEPPRAMPPPQSAPPTAIAFQSAPPPSVTGGEFTRAFVVPPFPEAPSVGPPPPKSKGFSTPGLSDSVSTEGSFTRLFQSTSHLPAEPSSAPPAPPPPPPSSFPTSSWQATAAPRQPQPTTPPPASFTSIFNALGSNSEPAEQPRASSPTRPSPDPAPYPPTSPAQSPPTQAMPTGGGITQLINLLSEGPSAASTARIAIPPTSSAPEPTPPADEEFLRVIQPSSAAPALIEQTPSSVQVPLSAPLVLPSAIKPITPPKLPTLPKLPAAALPAVPAPPRTKLQEMLPLLLVANAFLMLILIAVVVLMLHRK